MRITAEYIELKRKLVEYREHKSNLQPAKYSQPASLKADQEILRAFFERIECIVLDEIELYELAHGRREKELQEQIRGRQKWIDLAGRKSGRKALSWLRRLVREQGEARAELRGLGQRKTALQENINRFYREELPEWQKANKHTKERIAEVLKRLQSGRSAIPKESPEQGQLNANNRGPDPPRNRLIFKHTDDYRSIELDDKPYRATPQQAEIIKFMDEARQHGQGEVSTQQIKNATRCGKIGDSFRAGDGPKLWNHLVIRVENCRGMYRLNLPRPKK